LERDSFAIFVEYSRSHWLIRIRSKKSRSQESLASRINLHWNPLVLANTARRRHVHLGKNTIYHPNLIGKAARLQMRLQFSKLIVRAFKLGERRP
jgi:hypothetical protein